MIAEFLSKKKNVIALAIESIIIALKDDPQKEVIINAIFNSYGNPLYSKGNMFYQKKLQKIGEIIFDNISEVCTDNILNP